MENSTRKWGNTQPTKSQHKLPHNSHMWWGPLHGSHLHVPNPIPRKPPTHFLSPLSRPIRCRLLPFLSYSPVTYPLITFSPKTPFPAGDWRFDGWCCATSLFPRFALLRLGPWIWVLLGRRTVNGYGSRQLTCAPRSKGPHFAPVARECCGVSDDFSGGEIFFCLR